MTLGKEKHAHIIFVGKEQKKKAVCSTHMLEAKKKVSSKHKKLLATSTNIIVQLSSKLLAYDVKVQYSNLRKFGTDGVGIYSARSKVRVLDYRAL